MIARESIQQVIERADIAEVVGQFVNLKKRGANLIANCPFHNERTPSFNVNPARGIFKCFGCGKGGDAVTFIEEYEKFSFVEAIRWLANFYQIELQETEVSEEVAQQRQTEESLRIINDFAAKYFHDILLGDEEGSVVGGQYLMERGFNKEIIETFRLGYCLDEWDAFSSHALSQGYNKSLLEKAGLIKERNGRVYDNYKGRIIFPIFSNTGKILGFGARILKKSDTAPKYLNTPENELYSKSKVLYGLYQSRQAIIESNECFLVEGYTDVIALHQGGVKNVVASSGTSLTEGQLKLIGNLTKNLTILYDGDAAGVKAALRGMDMALSKSFRVDLVLLPEGHDPDSFIKEKGVDFKSFVAQNKKDFVEFVLQTGLEEAAGDPVKKAKLVNDIAETISKIDKSEDFTIQQHYLKKCATALEVEEEGLLTLVNKFIRTRLQQESRRERAQTESTPEPEPVVEQGKEEDPAALLLDVGHREEWQLLKLLIEYGEKPYQETTVAQFFFETVDVDLFEHPLSKKMISAYHNYWMDKGEAPQVHYFVNHEDKQFRQKTADLLAEPFIPTSDWATRYKIEVPHGEEIYQEEVTSTFAYFELKLLRRLLQENWQQMQQEKNAQRIEVLMKTHIGLKEQEKQLMALVIVR